MAFLSAGISYVTPIAVKRLVEMLDMTEAGLDSVKRTVLNREKSGLKPVLDVTLRFCGLLRHENAPMKVARFNR